MYAITVFRGLAWYYVLDDHALPYPVWKPAALFELSSGAIPANWVIGYVRTSSDDVGYPILSFPEWANDRYYYERLVDGDAAAVAIFEKRRSHAEQVS